FLIACFLLLSVFGHHRKKFFLIAMPALFIFQSVLSLIYAFFSPGLDRFLITTKVIFSFPEFYIHTIMAVVVIACSLIELLSIFGKIKNRLSHFAFPTLFITVGYLFILHPHGGFHDENVSFLHSLFGSLLIFAGIMLLVQRLVKKHKIELITTTDLAAAALIILAVLLVQFKEPALSYQTYFPVGKAQSSPLEIDTPAVIYITEKGVVPQNIKMKREGKVVFYQVDESVHDMASGPHPTHAEYPPLNIGFLKRGESKIVAFPEVGSFGFHDHINDSDTKLQGKIEILN
ncbi:MAG: hypothetical protein ACD_30C00006G0003, partial [uncultured bacterium]